MPGKNGGFDQFIGSNDYVTSGRTPQGSKCRHRFRQTLAD